MKEAIIRGMKHGKKQLLGTWLQKASLAFDHFSKQRAYLTSLLSYRQKIGPLTWWLVEIQIFGNYNVSLDSTRCVSLINFINSR